MFNKTLLFTTSIIISQCNYIFATNSEDDKYEILSNQKRERDSAGSTDDLPTKRQKTNPLTMDSALELTIQEVKKDPENYGVSMLALRPLFDQNYDRVMNNFDQNLINLQTHPDGKQWDAATSKVKKTLLKLKEWGDLIFDENRADTRILHYLNISFSLFVGDYSERPKDHHQFLLDDASNIFNIIKKGLKNEDKLSPLERHRSIALSLENCIQGISDESLNFQIIGALDFPCFFLSFVDESGHWSIEKLNEGIAHKIAVIGIPLQESNDFDGEKGQDPSMFSIHDAGHAYSNFSQPIHAISYDFIRDLLHSIQSKDTTPEEKADDNFFFFNLFHEFIIMTGNDGSFDLLKYEEAKINKKHPMDQIRSVLEDSVDQNDDSFNLNATYNDHLQKRGTLKNAPTENPDYKNTSYTLIQDFYKRHEHLTGKFYPETK